ncbi:Aste57867_4025 [Aphanomyces stellatus]|uniref:Aste57867_4025 protein n=1 Tax=Aphanomyces stellatus TaxID=120398 RepID=A0A485KAS5_9STRA|nr:hypothetical protein As57867_004014 [Aphanomyces stellatus]VFT81160.1 Aste57867_4025 [Aphanomyces stellatus]
MVVYEAQDLGERLSYISEAAIKKAEHGENGGYGIMKSPADGDLEDGALVEGGALAIMSLEACGLFSQYFAIGVLLGGIPQLAYPVFLNYLNMEGYQIATYGVLVNTGWYFKPFFGMLTDCVPLFGYRRKSWMLIGWTIAMICLAIMAFMPFEAPYCGKKELCSIALKKVSAADQATYFNFHAPDSGFKFIMISVVMCLGYMMAAVSSDAMVVQYAQREPLAIRGRIQTAIYIVRYVGQTTALLCIGILLNGPNYKGSFDFNVSPNVIYGIFLAPCVMVVVTTVFLVVEIKSEGTPFKLWCSMVWDLLQKRALWQVATYRLVNNLFFNISSTAGQPIQSIWAKTEPLNDSFSGIVGNVIFISIMIVVGKYGLLWNWRWTIALSTLGIMMVDSFVIFMTIFDGLRNQWFFTGAQLADQIPSGIRFIVGTYCAVELADAGNEGSVYGFITALNNVSSPIATVLYKLIDSYFAVTNPDLIRDDMEVRWDVAYTYFIAYGFKLFSLVWLFLLPRQKQELQELKRTGSKSSLAAILLLTAFVSCLLFSMAVNILSIFPSTKCLRVAGGKGCPPK